MNLQEINSIISKINNKVYSPIYFFMGEETYYIDLFTDLLEKNVLNEDEKSFNQTILYGKDSSIDEIISVSKRYPVMSKYQLIIVKEAQDLSSKIDDLISYLLNPMLSTILVINFKYKSIDKRKKIYKAILKFGLVFESKKLFENQISTWISDQLKLNEYSIEFKASQMLVEYLGNDLKMIDNQLNKLKILKPKGNKITAELIEQNIGISKDYNVFEFRNAIGSGDLTKALRIADYFSCNTKSYPIPYVLGSVFNYFLQIFQLNSLKNKSDNNISSLLGINRYFIGEYKKASILYPMKKISKIISIIKEIDLKSKGLKSNSNTNEKLLNQLVVQIMT